MASFLLLLVLGFAFTGYLLPWDMKAFFATKVGINIGGILPVLGTYVVKLMQGGSEMGTLTLSRFFSLHVVVLPLLLLLTVGIHLYYIRLHGPTPPGIAVGASAEYKNRFYPLQLFRDSTVVFLVLAVVIGLAIAYGAPLEQKADPNDTHYIPRPDWYFYSLFQLLKIFEGNLEIVGAVILPGAFMTLLLLLPFIDRSPERKLSRRPVAAAVGGATIVMILLLTFLGAYEGNKARASAEAAPPAEGESPADVTPGDPARGFSLFAELKCGSCHWNISKDENFPPGLEYAGSKYKEAWLFDYLKDPHRVRWEEKNRRPVLRMPDFNLTDREARDLAAHLASFKMPGRFPSPEFDFMEADSDMVISGEELVAEYGCAGCHKIGNVGQNIAPELSHIGSKLQDAYLFHIVSSPDDIVPGTGMKDFQLEDIDVEDIVSYLRTLK